jgi:5-methylcytosine-specific restriction endonuclease McrA
MYARNRRAKKAGAEGTFTAEEFQQLCEFYSHRCLCCGKMGVKLTTDHVQPLSKGGSNHIDNIQPLCGPCNSRKHAKTQDYRILSGVPPWLAV